MNHGSRNTYLRYGCRCEPCTAANSAYKTERVERLRNQTYPKHRQAKQWPLAPLLELVPDLRERLNLDTGQLRLAEEGLSDRTADRWATRCGWHPVSVWGWAWVDAGLRVTDEQFIYGDDRAEPGWRQAALHNEPAA